LAKEIETKKPSLEFSSRVLGKKASERLRSVRGKFLTFRSTPLEAGVVDVYLDGELLGKAEIKGTPEKVYLGEVIQKPFVNALGGFDSAEEQAKALKRAGFRYKPLNEYTAYMVYFWASWGTRAFISWVSKPKATTSQQEETGSSTEPTQSETENPGIMINAQELEGDRVRLEKMQAQLEKDKERLAEGWERLKQERAKLESDERWLEVAKELDSYNEDKAPELAERLRFEIADMLEPPGRKEVRMWQLRTAGQILSHLCPYLKVDIALAHKDWLNVSSNKGD